MGVKPLWRVLAAMCLLCVATHGMKVHVELEECATIQATQPDMFWSSVVGMQDAHGHDIRLDLSLKSSTGEKVYEQIAVREDTFKIYLNRAGTYRFCIFINPAHQLAGASSATDVWWDWHFGEHLAHSAAHRRDTTEMSAQLSDLASQLEQLQAEVRYLHAREQRHRQTVESTHARVLTYAVLRGGALLAVSGFQVFCVTKMFSSPS